MISLHIAEHTLLCLPFTGILLSIAFGPLIIKHLWHKIENFVLSFWGVLALAVIFWQFGAQGANHIQNSLMEEYLPFVVMISALYVISSGMLIEINSKPTPFVNTIFLLIGACLSNFLGTTGASALLIRPLIQINKTRFYKTHTIIFFIFLVANVGGSVTPIGDPPLFLGFLEGVPFLWFIKNLSLPFLWTVSCLLVTYYFTDRFFMKKENVANQNLPQQLQKIKDFNVKQKINTFKISLKGKKNLFFLFLSIASIFTNGFFIKNIHINFWFLSLQLSDLVRDISLIFFATASYIFTPKYIHKNHNFSFAPISEISKIFLVIFISMIPVVALLKGNIHTLKNLGLYDPKFLFFLTGLFSAFLDNAPSYMLFLKATGLDICELTGTFTKLLIAISIGSVYMGALTYIGNAPNFMILSIAKTHHINMPNFFAYILWSVAILLPICISTALIFL